ncbi:hypothetical protein PV328_006072 [Microctonus aethiopoides]|uniref:Uncharacterized protein n=1 Tax=Microctonus aethiopoides TaxID=144406 RepID=A0AA39FNL3_9HYME|nr:hypothetical protein PV328_006072 [Microctonus aethiopoides]
MALKGSRIMEAFEDKRLDFRCFTYICAVLLALSETFRVLVSNSQLDFIGFSFPIALCVFIMHYSATWNFASKIIPWSNSLEIQRNVYDRKLFGFRGHELQQEISESESCGFRKCD